jgi:hypothetical protein
MGLPRPYYHDERTCKRGQPRKPRAIVGVSMNTAEVRGEGA